MFLLLVIYSLGVFWSTFFPRRSWVMGTRLEWLGPTLHFINPGTFKIKEVRFTPSHLSALLTPNAARHRKHRCFKCFLRQHRRPQFFCATSKCSFEFSATGTKFKLCHVLCSYSITRKLTRQPPFLRPSQLPFSVMESSVSSGLSLYTLARWCIGQ